MGLPPLVATQSSTPSRIVQSTWYSVISFSSSNRGSMSDLQYALNNPDTMDAVDRPPFPLHADHRRSVVRPRAVREL